MIKKIFDWSLNKWILSLFVLNLSINAYAAEKTFVVTNTKDSGEGSLRAAIEASNENSEGPNQIVFKLEAGSGSEIEISKPLVINSKTTLNGKIGNKNITIIGNEEINGISIYDITDVTVKNVTVKGCNYGVYAVRALDVKVDSSEFVENITGFYCASGRFEVSNSLASGNHRGISMTQPMFAGGTTIGSNVHDLTVRNCVVGLNKTCSAAYPNVTGIFISGSSLFPKIYDCVIAGNTGYGIDLYAHSARIAKNYIGMNRNFKDFGNGASGAKLKENGGTVLLGSFTDRDSCNYIGFNKEYGVAGQSGDVYNNYIGLAYNKERDEYTATPNGMGGINLSYGFFVDNVIGFNKGNGIEGGARIENNVIGGDGIHTFANEGYGAAVKSAAMTGNKIFSNKLGGVYRSDAYYSGNDDVINVSKNYFGGDQPFAYDDIPHCYKPEITSIKDNGKTVTVTGTVKFSDATFSMPSYLDDEKVGIELYISEGKESAVEYIGYVESDKDGNWTYEVKKSEFNTKKYFTATAIHYEYSQGQYLKNYNFTSALAEPKSLIKDLKRYYVKVNAEGIGDGSSWENAMSSEDFAFWLPKAKDDVTFYVAEGIYSPTLHVKDFDLYPWNLSGYGSTSDYPSYMINNRVSIVGGFAKDAKTGAKANSDEYKTYFTYVDPKALAEAWPNFPADLFESSKYTSFNQLFKKSCSSIFVINDGSSASIEGVTICGQVSGRGAIIVHNADLNLNKTTFEYLMGQYDGGGCAGVAMAGDCNLNIDRCLFRNLIGSYSNGVITTNYRNIEGSSKITIKNSAFKDTYSKYCSGLINLGENSSLLIEKCTFDGAGDDGVNGNFDGGIVLAKNAEVTIKNSTIANVSAYRGGVVKAENSDVELFNNTIINVNARSAGSYIYAEGEGKFTSVGNLVSTSANERSFIFMGTEGIPVTDKSNVYVNPNLTSGGYASVKYPMDESTVITFDDLASFVDGKYDEDANTFIPNVEKKANSYTPVIALTNDVLPSGESVRFALSNTVVDTDQNEMSRLSNTCVGAYELLPDSYTLVVTNELCEGEGSFRNAIVTANKLEKSMPVSIVFDFEGRGTKTICLDTTVTLLRRNLYIDGTTYPDSIIIKATDNTFDGLKISSCGESDVNNSVTIKGLAFTGFVSAVHVFGTNNVVVDSCTFYFNYIGVYNHASDVVVEKSVFTNNDQGFYSSYVWIVNCDGYRYRSIIKNNIFGLSADQKSAMPNRIGIHIGGSSSSSSGEHELRIHNNVISGNLENGILAEGGFANNSYGLITKNLIGTNKYGDDFGNGANGIFTEIPGGSLYIGTNNLDSANVIVFNHENGVAAEKRNPLNIKANYIGMSPDFKPMPNHGSGIYSANSVNVSNCYIGFNKEDGIKLDSVVNGGYTTFSRAYVKDCFIGGDGKHDFGNEGYGINGITEINGTHIWNNKLGGVYKEHTNTSYPGLSIVASQNLFGGKNQPFAISDRSSKDIHAPEILKVEKSGTKAFKISGKVEKLASDISVDIPRYVDESSVTIELFSNDGEDETAHKYLGVMESDEDGNFEFTIPNKDLNGAKGFTATATFRFADDHGIGTRYYTSELSKMFKFCTNDTTFVRDTVEIGGEFLGEVYSNFGVYDSIPENLQTAAGCDSVVMHTLYVKPSSTNLNYYVKTKRVGKGDGSDWDNAMNGDDFSACLPLAPKGATFYVAAGTYRPIYDLNVTVPEVLSRCQYTINNDVIIRGGYPSDATGKYDLSEPDKYVTLFDGENLGTVFFAFSNAKNVTFDGISIDKSNGYGFQRYVEDADSLLILNSVFSKCEGTAVFEINPSKFAGITNTVFSNNESSIYFGNVTSAEIKGSSFVENKGYLLVAQSIADGASLKIDSTSFIDNVGNLRMSGKVSVEITNSSFDNSSGHYDGSSNPISIRNSKIENSKGNWLLSSAPTIYVDSCIFNKNNTYVINALSSNLSFHNSVVTESDTFPIFNVKDCDIQKSTFYNNGHQYVDATPMITSSSVKVENSTFSNNKSGYGIFYAGDVTLNNNTILGVRKDIVYGSLANSRLTGNIILYNDSVDMSGGSVIIANGGHDKEFFSAISLFKNNVVFGNKTIYSIEMESNYFVNELEIDKLLEGSYTKGLQIFTPDIKDNGGFTPTVALLDDKLADGTSIRFPIKETNVKVDQRGFVRLDETCMGAYEIVCTGDTTFVRDTILCGESFKDSIFTQVGRHELFETFTDRYDCDSVVKYTLFVKPTGLNYYVKTKRVGKGDGSDWDNAMNGDDFAACLPLAPKGATFYVAEGTYKPIYDAKLDEPSNSSNRQYTINNDVTIRGGYSDNATGTVAPSNPKVNKTIFDGDILGDDVKSESKGTDGYVKLTLDKREDNAFSLFQTLSNDDLHIAFDGVCVRNSNYGLNILNSGKNLKISNSEFSYNNTSVNLPYQRDELEVYNSEFSKNVSSVINMPQAYKLTMDSVLFENNQHRIIDIPTQSGINSDHEVRLNRIFAYSNGDSSAIINSIGHDFELKNSEFKNNHGLLYLLDNTRIDSTVFEKNYGDITKYGELGFDINECTFVDNKAQGTYIYTAKNGSSTNHFSITKSSFVNTDSKGLLYAVTDSINIDSSLFSGSSHATIDMINYKTANVSRSYFSENENANLQFTGLTARLYGNTFWKNKSNNERETRNLFDFNSTSEPVLIANNTLVSNVSSDLIELHGCSPEMLNNTILGNINTSYVIAAYPGDLKMEGNIVLGNTVDSKEGLSNIGTEVIYSRWSNIEYKNNILPCIVDRGDVFINEIDQSIINNNIFSIFDNTNAPEELKEVSNSNEDILTSLFDGEYDSNTGLFTPVLTDKGVLTPVVVLKKETLSDGTFVRFPRLDKVTEDQRVESRFDFSCMGAYEMTCEKPFKAEGEVLNESTCHGQYGGKRAVVKIYDEDGEPSEGKFTFINKAFSPKIEDKNIEIYDKGVFVLHNAGKPLDTLIISNDLCTQKIGLTPYQSSDSEKTANIKGVESKDQTCYGVNNGSVQFEYSDFHSFYDLSFRLESLENGYYTTKEMRLSEGVVTFDSVPAGKYKAFVLLAVEGCVMIDVDTLFVDSVEIKAPQDPMNILEVSTSDNHCNTLYDGIAEFKVSGWSMDEGWSWKYLIANEDTITKTEAEQVSKDTFDISIHGLKGAKYKFVLSDVCGQSIDTAFIVTDNIPEPVKIEKSVVGYTCPSVSDGKITYTVTNWDNSFVALMNEDTILPKTVVKNVASFVADSLSDSLCVLTIVNMCNEEMSDTTDLFTYSLEHEGFTITNVLFDSEKAKCDINARILDVTVKGGHKNIYDFCVMTVAGDTVEHVILDSTHFISNTLPDGQFMIVASIPEGCSSGYDKDLVVKPTVKLTARKTEAECGDKKSTLILVNADSPEYQSKLYLLNEKGVWVETDSILSGGYKKTLTESLTTVYTAIKSTTAECSLFAPIENYHEENILSNSEFKTDVKTVDQHCFNVKNGELDLVYSGFDSEYDLVLVAVNKDTKEEFVSKEMTKDTIFLTDLDSGLYDVSIRLAIGGCALEGAEKPLGQYHIEGVDSMLKIVKDSVSQSKCYSNFVATATIYFKNWQKDIYSWNYYLDDEFRYNGKPEEMGIDTSITIFADRGGLAKFAIFDVCKDTLKREFVIDSLEKPSVQILVDSSYVDLKCAYDSGCVVVKLKGGNRDSSRFFLEYQNPSNVNFFGLVPADTMFKIYDFIEGKADTTSSYTPNLKENVVCRLDSGTYTVVYQNLDTIGCKGDYSLDRIKITRPAPVYLKLATNEVRCFDKAEGVVNFIPERLGRAWEKYTLANDSDKTTGSNWAKWLFLDDEAQYKKYRLGRSNKDEAHYYSGHVSDSLPYRSNVFYEIAKIAITAKNQDSTVLMKHLAQDSARIPLPAMRNKGDYESVPTDWIGFNTLYADTYYVAVTDTFGCIYVDSFSVEGPKDKKLEIVSVIPPTADSNCDANKRRITFTAAGGWGDYIFSVKNLDDPNSNSDVPIEDLPEDKFYGGLLDVDYVQDVKYDTIYDSENKRNQVRYRSRILNSGRHVVSVFDKEFCYATADTILIKADYTMDGKKIFDWCGDPDNNRLIPVVTSSNGSYAQIDSFTVRIGHATIKKDSVEYRYKQKWQTIIDENNNKTSGLGNLPMGKIGVIAYVGDGCSAFNEFTYERRDGFVPLKIVAKEFVDNFCYDDSTGDIFVDLSGGNEVYTKFELDGKDVHDEFSNVNLLLFREMTKFIDVDTDGAIDSTAKDTVDPVWGPTVVNDRSFFKKVNAKYTPRATIEKWAYSNLGENPTYTDSLAAYNKLWNSVKNDSNYIFKISNMPWGNFLAKDSMHYLVAEDIKGCVDTLKFIIPHPDKLEIEVASSPVCPDGAGRLFAKSSKGGVPPYSWAIDDYSISEYDRLFPIDNPNKIVPKKPTNEGFKDFNGYSDFKDYYTGFQPSDHIPAMEGNVHYMYIKDSHECVAKSKEAKVDKKLTWDEISQDFIVSTWHSYGDVLVVIDKTDYENLKVAADNSKYAYTYDSMHVEVVLKSPEDQYLKALPQMKELYTYGIPENNNVNSDENQEEMTVDWRGTTYVGPMWGVPAEVAVTVRTDEEYDKVAEQFNFELGSLKGKISGLKYQILVCDSIINHEGKYFNASGSKVQDAINRKYEYQKEIKTLNDSIDNAYGSEFDYTNTICNISQIKQAFSPLVPEKDALRMSFIKLEPTDKAGNDYVKDMLSKKGKLPFYIRTTAYVDGCDITTEHNLYLTFEDSIPYPIPNYKETLTLLPTPNPATNGYCTVRATVNKKLDSTNELYYYLTEADGKIVIAPTKLDGISPVETIIKYEDNSNDSNNSNNSNSFEYSYDIPVYGLETGKEYIFVATTKNRVESAKILTK